MADFLEFALRTLTGLAAGALLVLPLFLPADPEPAPDQPAGQGGAGLAGASRLPSHTERTEMKQAPEYNKILCRTCGHLASYVARAHACPGNLNRLTAYTPNIGRVTKNANPAYRKHAGSRQKRVRRTAKWMTLIPFCAVPGLIAERT